MAAPKRKSPFGDLSKMPQARSVAGRTSLPVKTTTRRVGESKHDRSAIRKGLEDHGLRTGKGGRDGHWIRDVKGRFA